MYGIYVEETPSMFTVNSTQEDGAETLALALVVPGTLHPQSPDILGQLRQMVSRWYAEPYRE